MAPGDLRAPVELQSTLGMHLTHLWMDHASAVIISVLVILGQAALISALLVSRARGRRSEQCLRISEERYREVVESQSDMVCRYLPDTTLTFVNEAYCRFFGKPREQLVGRKFLELIPANLHEKVKKTMATLVEKKERISAEHEVILPDGKLGWQHWEDYVILGARGEVEECQGIGHDITERKRAEQAQRINEERMMLAAEAANLGFWVWDIPADQAWMTEARRQLMGLNGSANLTFADLLQRVHPDDRAAFENAVRRAKGEERRFEHEYRVVFPNGEIRWIASRGRCLADAEGTPSVMVGISMDITARKISEEAMQNLVHATRLAVVGELTASIAHEMNQPLGAILSNADAAELLLQSTSPPLDEIGQILEDIRKDDLRASEVIRHMRTLLRKRELQMQRTDIKAVALDAIRLVAGDARRRGVVLETNFGEEPAEVLGDAVQLQQVLLNLILNGMDAMNDSPKGERCLMISVARNGCETIETVVTDTGHGISDDKLPRVFDSFFTTKKEGMGLGLAIARSIIEAHCGKIWAENNATGPGASFRFAIPSEKRSAAD